MRLEKMTKKSRVLNITHKDLDGIGCSIVLANTFDPKSIEYRSAKYSDIDSIMKNTSYNKYDFVILTDVSPNEQELINISDKIILLDHHDTAKNLHNVNKRRVVVDDTCATILTKKFCESVLKADLSHLEDLVTVINDYDLWIHNDKRSKELNELYFRYWDQKFRNRFLDGNLTYTEDEKNFLKQRERDFLSLWDSLEIYPMEDVNGVFCQSVQRVNDLCDKLLKEEGYDYVFCRNSENGNLSVRTKKDNIHLGELLKDIFPLSGGGHAKAGGVSSVSMSDCKDTLNKIIVKIKLNSK